MSDPNKDSRVVSLKRQSGELSYEQGVNPGPEEPGLLSKQFHLFICIFLIKIFFKFISSIFNWRKSQQLWKGHTLIPSAVTLLSALCPHLPMNGLVWSRYFDSLNKETNIQSFICSLTLLRTYYVTGPGLGWWWEGNCWQSLDHPCSCWPGTFPIWL